MATTTRHHIEISKIDASGNLFILYPKNTLKDVYTSYTSGVTIEGKINFFGTCNTAADTAAKTVSISGFSLTTGAHLTVVFTNGISVANATLNVNGAGAKAIYFEGVALKANAVRAKARVHMVYDGSYFHVLSGASNAAYVSNANTTKFYLLGTPTNAAGSPGAEYFDTGVYVSTTEGQLVATSFSGNGSALTNLNASNIASGTLAAARLATSGVTAGTYGPTTDATLAASGTFTVPKVVTDAYGRVTSASNITYTLPADKNTDVNVTNNVENTTKFYLVGSTSNANTTGTLVKDTGVYVSTTAGQLVANTMQANTFYLGGTSASINSTNYTGQAATVGTISGYLVDSCASGSANGVTTKALTANQGYLLQNQINTLNSNKLSTSASCNKNWVWSGQSGQPSWLWGSNDGSNMYVWNPSNFHVNYADTSDYSVFAVHSHILRTYSADGGSHGEAYLLKCKHNVDGDGRFKLFMDEGNQIKVNYADFAGSALGSVVVQQGISTQEQLAANSSYTFQFTPPTDLSGSTTFYLLNVKIIGTTGNVPINYISGTEYSVKVYNDSNATKTMTATPIWLGVRTK